MYLDALNANKRDCTVMNYYKNYLKENLDLLLLSELKTIKDWKDFNRNNSHMKEYYGEGKFINRIRQYFHSKECIKWIEKETGIDGLLVDPYSVGEGVSLMESQDQLDPHIDFNWNDRIKMHRAVNLCVYLGECEGGEHCQYDDKKENVVSNHIPEHNSAILFKHSETSPHGDKPVTSGQRFTMRQFYYKSEATVVNPHQSLYWYNPDRQMPTNS